jgi:hypothetical protein
MESYHFTYEQQMELRLDSMLTLVRDIKEIMRKFGVLSAMERRSSRTNRLPTNPPNLPEKEIEAESISENETVMTIKNNAGNVVPKCQTATAPILDSNTVTIILNLTDNVIHAPVILDKSYFANLMCPIYVFDFIFLAKDSISTLQHHMDDIFLLPRLNSHTNAFFNPNISAELQYLIRLFSFL